MDQRPISIPHQPLRPLAMKFGLFLGADDTADIKQQRSKGKKNKENSKNNWFGGWCFFVGVLCVLHQEETKLYLYRQTTQDYFSLSLKLEEHINRRGESGELIIFRVCSHYK